MCLELFQLSVNMTTFGLNLFNFFGLPLARDCMDLFLGFIGSPEKKEIEIFTEEILEKAHFFIFSL